MKVVSELQQKQRQVIEKARTTNRNVTIAAKYRTAYDAATILALAEEQEREKEEERLRKEEKAKQREEKRFKKLEEKEARARRLEEERRLAREAKEEKVAARILTTCRVVGCKTRFRSSAPNLFSWCDYCDDFGICGMHKHDLNARELLEEHEKVCGHPPKRQRKI